MPRILVLCSVVAVVLVSMIPLGSRRTVSAQDATPAAVEATLETLIETTVPAAVVPTEPTTGFLMWRASIDPEVEVTVPAEMVACCPGPVLEHIVAGELTLRVEGPLRVVRGSIGGTPGPEEEITPGTEVVLRQGDTAIYAQELPTVYTNRGTEPVDLISGGLFAQVSSAVPVGYRVHDFEEVFQLPELPPGPVTLVLARATLDTNAVIPAPPLGAARAAIAGPEGGALGSESDGSFRNVSRRPMVAYALSLLPTEAGVAPGTPGVTPTA
jgi:hypothetical protein